MTRKILYEIKRIAPEAEITVTGKNHYAIHLPNGTVVIASGTPGGKTYFRKLLGDIRRQLKKPNPRTERASP